MGKQSSTPSVRAAASQLLSILKEHGFIKIIVFPDLDSLIAASLVAESVRRQGSSFEIEITPLPPRMVTEPSILLGYGVEALDSVEFKARSIMVWSGGRFEGLAKIVVLSDDKSSVAGLSSAMLSEIVVATDILPLAIAAAYWRGLDTGRKGEFMGLEASLIELLSMGGDVDGGLTLRLYRWFEEPVETSLEITVDPFIPGLTGRREAIEKLLASDPRLSRLKGTSVKDAGEEPVTVLATTLYDRLKKASRVARRPSEVVGYSYYTPRLLVKDLRELSYIAASVGEKHVEYIVSLAVSPNQVTGYMHYIYYTKLFESLVSSLEKAYSMGTVEPRRIGRLKIAVFDVEPLTPFEKQVKLLGTIPADSLAAATVEGKVAVSLETLKNIVGYKNLVEMIVSGCIRPIEGTLLGEVDEKRCT